MATIDLGGKTLDVLYVDSTATGANNGSTPADALTALPAMASLAANTAYIIRRGTGTYALTPGGTSAAVNLALIGMPKDTDGDPLYAHMPAEVQTAWGSDAAAYAVIGNARAGTTNTFSGAGLFIHNVRLYATCSVVQTTWAFTISGDFSTLTRVFFAGLYDIEVTAAATLAAAASASVTCGGVLITSKHFRTADSEYQMMHGNTATGTNNTSNNTALRIDAGGTVGTASVENCVFRRVYGTTTAATSDSAALVVKARQVYIRNCEFDLAEQRGYSGTATCIAPGLVIDAVRLVLTGISMTTRSVGANTRTTVNFVGAYISSGYPPLIDIYSSATSATYGCDFEISDITLDGSGWQYAPGAMCVTTSASQSVVITGAGRVAITNVSFTATQARYSSSVYGLFMAPIPGAVVDSCSFHYTTSSAVAVRVGSGTLAPNTYDPCGPIFKNLSATGILVLTQVAVAEITSLTVPATDVANPLQFSASGVFYIKSLVLPTAWPDSQSVMTLSTNATASGAQCFIDTVNIPIFSYTPASATTLNSAVLYIANNGEAGNFNAFSYWLSLRTTPVKRTGGANASLAVTPLRVTADRKYRVEAPPQNVAMRAVTNAATGKRKAILYVATKGLTARQVYSLVSLRVAAPSGGGSAKKLYDSAGGYIEVDTVSTWENDPGVSKYRIVVPVVADRAEDLGVAFAVEPLTGFNQSLYIDPKIEVTA